MSTYKMTFSLASLVLILMFAFVAMPVMAHNPTTGVEDASHTGHPINSPQVDDAATTDINEAVAAHTSHPMVTSIVLKGDNTRGTTAQVTDPSAEGAETTDNQFTLVITFNEALTEAATDTSPSENSPLQMGNFSPVILNKDKLTAATDGTTPAMVEIADATRVEDSDGKQFEAVVTVTDSFPSGTAADDHAMMYIKVSIDAAAGFGVASRPQIDIVNGGASLASTAYSFMLVNDLGDPPTPTTGEAGTITGDANLENPFPITITFAKAVDLSDYVGKEADVIGVTGGGSVVLNSLYDDSPDDKPMTVWKATVEPYRNAAQAFGFITVTLKTTAKVKPAAADMGGELTVRADGTLESITVPDDADDQALFVVTLTFAESLADTVNVEATDLKVTPEDDEDTADVDEGVEIGDIGPVLGSDRKVWHVEITPVDGEETIVELSDAGKVKFGDSSEKVTVAVKGAPPPSVPTVIEAVDATYDDTKNETTLTGMLAANGFAVVVAEDLPDIQRFYAEGGSISVLSSLTGAEAKSVVISEIMWGLNLRAIGDERSAHQFIELYNTSGATIDLKDVKLLFDDANTPTTAPTDMVLLDQVSNVSGIGWLISAAPGSSGRIAVPDDVTTFVPSDLISMYRNITYANVTKTHNADDAAKNRVEQLKAIPSGSDITKWAESSAADTYGVNLIGSPGKQHFVAYAVLTSTPIPRSTFVINEIGNHSTDAYDWVELRNVALTKQNLRKIWRLSQVTKKADGTGEDKALVTFDDSKDYFVEPGAVVLIVNTDPYQNPNHPIAAGINITHGSNRAETTGVISHYFVNSGLTLANSGQTLLILRNSNDNGHLGKPNGVQDVVGTLQITDSSASLRTDLWPLVATGKPNKDEYIEGAVKEQQDFRSGKTYERKNAGSSLGKHTVKVAGHTGLGYKRGATGNGTPGYPNGGRIDTEAALTDGAIVTISEIMYAKNRSEPQWIELYNSSLTQAVNLNEWKLKIEQDRDAEDYDIRSTVTTNNLGGNITIQPNQTVLIVSNTTGRTSRSSQGGIDFPASRIINLWAQKDKLEVATGKTRLTYSLLSQTAFRLTLMDKGGAPVDVAGNLGDDGMAMWDLPFADAEEVDGRSSIIRRYDEGVPRDGTMVPLGDGTGAWVLASASPLADIRFNETYYGSPDDNGTPGFRVGGPLPVSLSKFRPERLDSGEIVVRWITESELNNAGFNILRSDTRDGQFTKLNTKLIAGKGTTSERTSYEYADTSAKPNVVYYYQIQDVSFDGQVQTLRQSRLKGQISAAGKLTTTWGELKALQ